MSYSQETYATIVQAKRDAAEIVGNRRWSDDNLTNSYIRSALLTLRALVGWEIVVSGGGGARVETIVSVDLETATVTRRRADRDDNTECVGDDLLISYAGFAISLVCNGKASDGSPCRRADGHPGRHAKRA